MTRRQLLGMYNESHIIEAREQLRLLWLHKLGHPSVKADKYIDDLKAQADPPDFEEAEALGISGFEQAFAMFGKEVRDVKGYVDGRKTTA